MTFTDENITITMYVQTCAAMQAIRRFCTKEKSVIVKEENRKKWSKGEEQDKILRMAVIVVVVILIIGGIIVAVKLLNPRVDMTDGTKKLPEGLEMPDSYNLRT